MDFDEHIFESFSERAGGAAMKNRRTTVTSALSTLFLAFLQLGMLSAPAVSGGLFPNDAGPEEVDVASYPADVQKGYRLMLTRCSACHKVARPINAQFLELSEDETKKAQAEQPAIFKNKLIWEIAPKSWSLKVHRMMLKPGSKIKPEEGKQIYEFLVYDSKIRKTGANAETWRKNRAKLVEEFSKENPDAYKTLFGDAPPPAVEGKLANGEKK